VGGAIISNSSWLEKLRAGHLLKYKKTRYRGSAKNAAQLLMLFGLNAEYLAITA